MAHYNDNYPPGFNGKFPWDNDDICFLDYDNAYESTLQWLEENPNEFYADPKKLFLAMGGTLRTQDDWEDFSCLKKDIERAIDKFDKEDIINECNNMKKKTIRLTESDLKRIISESVKKVLREEKYIPRPRLDNDENPGYYDPKHVEKDKKALFKINNKAKKRAYGSHLYPRTTQKGMETFIDWMNHDLPLRGSDDLYRSDKDYIEKTKNYKHKYFSPEDEENFNRIWNEPIGSNYDELKWMEKNSK